jgi:pimeloyl-ACP methyl ester carboxylesterase
MTAATTVMSTRDVTIGDTFVRISSQGFPLVFVHGFTTTSELWREQAEEFSKAGCPDDVTEKTQ